MIKFLLLLVGWLLLCKSVHALDDFVGRFHQAQRCRLSIHGYGSRFFVKEGIELKLVEIPGSLARRALLARQLDGMEFGNEGTSGPAT